MWDYLSKLHPLLPYSLIILIIIAIVIIALKGRLILKWGKNTIGIGSDTEKPTSSTGEIKPINTTISEKKRSCSDCLHIVTSEYDKYKFNKLSIDDKILNYRMNYTEEKLTELEDDITKLFEIRLDNNPDEKESYLEIESKLFYGLFKEALNGVKKEIRRSCKENGFCKLPDIEFANFVTDKSKLVISILIRELRNIYPSYGTLVSVDCIIQDIESLKDKIREYLKDIFVYAKQVILDNAKEVKELEEKYQKWEKDFIT